MLIQKTTLKLSVDYHLLFFIALFVIFAPFCHLFPVINLFDDQRMYEILLLSLALTSLTVSRFYRIHVLTILLKLPLLTRVGLLAIFILGSTSALTAPLVNYALLELSCYIALFLLSLIVAGLFTQNPQLLQNTLFISAISSCIFYQITFFAGYLASFIENLPLVWPEPFSGFSNIRFFNQYQLWLFFLISAPLLIYPNLDSRLQKIITLTASSWAILLFASGSRGVVLAVFLSLLISWFIFKKQAIPFLKLNSILLLLGFLGNFILFTLLPLLLDSDIFFGWRTLEQLATDAPRLYLWQTSLNYITTHPWLGIGPMHYAYYPNSIAMHPHNSLLQWAAELGLPSALILLVLIVWGIVRWVKQHKQIYASSRPEKQLLSIILFSTLIANLGYSLVDGVIVMPVSQILLATVSGWMFGFYLRENNTNNITLSINNFSIMLLASVTVITLLYTIIPSLMQRMDTNHQNNPLLMVPRFWQNGKISS